MIDAVLGVFGPLAKPECVRASKRGWLIWLRMLPALGAGVVLFLVAWVWATVVDFDPTHLPYYEVRVGLTALVGPLIALAFLVPPALLAGSLAGEKERGSIGLLLSTQASAADIVLSRWIGRLAPITLVAASAIPVLFLLALLAGLEVPVMLMLVGLPMAVGLGGGGFALGVSAVSKRGRDALLVVYLVEVGLMLGSAFGAGPVKSGGAGGSVWSDLIGAVGPGLLNPFDAIGPLVWGEQVAPAVASAMAWMILGLGGLGVASWRLRPSCLNDGAGSRRKLGQFRRRWGHRIPPVGDQPMLWKELHIERAGSLGRVGRWLGGLLVAWLGLGSAILGGLVVWDSYHLPTGDSAATEPWAVSTLAAWYAGSALLMSFLIQWSIGLRAGVTIASERERGTWDALLTSPLGGGEIIRGKLWGSLHALRWLIASALIAWTITWACGAMDNRQFVGIIAETVTWSALMAACGVAMSLRIATATKAMGATLALWLGAYLALKMLAFFSCLAVVGICLTAWMTGIQMGVVSPQSSVWFPMTFDTGMEWAFCGMAFAFTFTVVAQTRLSFDRAAGRMTGGTTAVQLDQLIHGRPMAPVRMEKPARVGG